MKIETINNIRVLTPEDEMWLCNKTARTFSDKVYLGVNADETEWRDVTETEREELEALWNSEEPPDDEATATDYINVLEEMGVDFSEEN